MKRPAKIERGAICGIRQKHKESQRVRTRLEVTGACAPCVLPADMLAEGAG